MLPPLLRKRCIFGLTLTLTILFSTAITAQQLHPPLVSQGASPKWQHAHGGEVTDIYVDRSSSNTVFTCGNGGRIYRSDDGGASWTLTEIIPAPGEAPVTARLKDLFFIGSDTGFCVGSGGTVLKWDDVTTTWDELEITPVLVNSLPMEIWSIYAEEIPGGGDFLVLLAGEHALIWGVLNAAGDSLTRADAVINCTQVPPGAMEHYKVDVATNGTDYTVLTASEPGLLFRAHFSQSDLTGLGAGTIGTFASAAPFEPRLITGAEWEFWDVTFDYGASSPDGDAYAVAGSVNDTGRGRIFSSQDGGDSWNEEHHACWKSALASQVPAGPVKSAPCHCYYIEDYNGLTSTWPGCDPALQDMRCPAGTPQCDRTHQHKHFNALYGVASYGSGKAIAAGYAGQRLIRIQPPGTPPPPHLWVDVSNQCEYTSPLNAAEASPSPGFSWWGGTFGYLQSITNGTYDLHATNHETTRPSGTFSTDYQAPNSLKNVRLTDIDAIGDQDFIAVGPLGAIFKSTDSGQSWARQQGGFVCPIELPVTNFEAVAMKDSMVGVAVGDDAGLPLVLFTADGGANWTEATLPTLGNAALHDVQLIEGDRFWAVGTSSLILESTDDGQNWTLICSPTIGVTWNGLCSYQVSGIIDEPDGLIELIFLVGTDTTSGEGVAYYYFDFQQITAGTGCCATCNCSPCRWYEIPVPPGVTELNAVDCYYSQSLVPALEVYAVGEKSGDGAFLFFELGAPHQFYEDGNITHSLPDIPNAILQGRPLHCIEVVPHTPVGGQIEAYDVIAGGKEGLLVWLLREADGGSFLDEGNFLDYDNQTPISADLNDFVELYPPVSKDIISLAFWAMDSGLLLARCDCDIEPGMHDESTVAAYR